MNTNPTSPPGIVRRADQRLTVPQIRRMEEILRNLREEYEMSNFAAHYSFKPEITGDRMTWFACDGYRMATGYLDAHGDGKYCVADVEWIVGYG